MAFTAICGKNDIAEGAMKLFHVGKKSILMVWPQGGELKAYRGRCPHADMPLTPDVANFDGKKVTCAHHNWGFDASHGRCVTHAVHNALHPYPLRVEGDQIQVDIGTVRPPRESSAG